MPFFKVVFEIELNANNVIDAAKKTREWLLDESCSSIYLVQEEDKPEVFQIDLGDDEPEALQLSYYHPIIKEF